MPDLLGDALLVLLGALLSALGFVGKRRLEGRGSLDAIEKHEKLLSLRERLRESGTTLEELSTLEQALLGRAESAAKVALDFERSAVELISSVEGIELTQTDMNIQAGEAAARADVRLDEVYAELTRQLGAREAEALRRAQAAWGAYREQHVAYCGEQYRGGSIRPLILGIAHESVTVARAVELERDLEEIKALRGPSN